MNPAATVKVVWTNTWYDPQKERQAAEALLDDGADVIAQHQDTPGPMQAAEARGKFGVGYNADMSTFAPDAVLTSPIWNWGVYYTDVVKQVQQAPGRAVSIGAAGRKAWSTSRRSARWFLTMSSSRPTTNRHVQDRRAGIFTIFTGPINDKPAPKRCPQARP